MYVPYSRKLLREKTFANFADLCNTTKVFSANFLGSVAHMEGVWYTTRSRRMRNSRYHHSFDRFTVFNMSLFKYIQTNAKPDGPLSTVVPFLSIIAANKGWNKLDKHEWGRHPDTDIQARNIWKLHSKQATEYDVTASVNHISYQSIAEGKYRAYVSTVQVLGIYRLVCSLDQLAMVDG